MKKIGIILGVTIVMMAVFLYIKQSYYPPLPINTITPKEIIKKLEQSDQKVVELVEEDGVIWFITKAKDSNVDENIKDMISEKGWTFKEKEGSGLFFEKAEERLIVTTEMWSSKYVLVKVPITFKDF